VPGRLGNPIDSTVMQGQERADGARLSVRAPLRNRVYRDLFIASFVSNIGTWMQNVGAQWFLVEKHSSALIVALVQTASLGPTLVLGLLAGVLADLFDRRRLLMVLQSYAVLVTLALAVVTYLGRLGPTSLLMFTGRRNFVQRLGKRCPSDWAGDWWRCRGMGRTRGGLRDQCNIVCGNHRCPGRLETTQAKRADRTRTLRPGHHRRIGIRS